MKKQIIKNDDWIQFGKRSKRLFHDIVSPLTSLCLGIEEMNRIISRIEPDPMDIHRKIEFDKLKGVMRLQNKSRIKIIELCRKIGFILENHDPAKKKRP